MEINEEHGSKYEANYSDVLTGNSINNSRKRRLIYEVCLKPLIHS